MSVQERKERERAHRHQLIVATARELAESQGWDAVTTRRLAERIEYSQPVIYGHFREGKREIVGAVALEGFAELTAAIRRAVADGPAGRAAVAALAGAYVDFAGRNPALYDAMFLLDTGLPFAVEATPAPLREAFGTLVETLGEVAGDADPAVFVEVFWSALHGLVSLTRSGRLPREAAAQRLTVLVDRFAGG
ncbi:TetR/AcrR family transcriptional regulator [Kitasatospora aureofaciens]|uniref:TetR/AcrR family transcriptional regulator n=1 Tax=Kitasatospora aureofaciens TaxID=1894 RepID=UPI001C43E036|nr:TetR/AcrR family transcriptional regulator [Kitasatospora aureofaciens]MBV6696940.1 TetR/AcrR family transcriptional regulator [Kitasatospora aureofaciens]